MAVVLIVESHDRDGQRGDTTAATARGAVDVPVVCCTARRTGCADNVSLKIPHGGFGSSDTRITFAGD